MTIIPTNSKGSSTKAILGPKRSDVRLTFQPALACARRAPRATALFAYAVVKHPLIGGGVAEWLKAAVC